MNENQDVWAPAIAPAVHRKIRILYITDSIWGMGGAELCLLRMIPYLQQSGCECHLLTFHSNETVRPFLDQFTCPVEHWQLNNVYDVNAFRIARRLRQFIREHEIDIVHTFFETADLWAGAIAKLSGVKILISSRRDMGILRAAKHHIGYRLLRGMFDQVQAVSEGVRRYTIESDGVNPDRTVTIYNGIEPKLQAQPAAVVQLRERLAITAGVPIIACVANIRQVKGIDVLVRAMAVVRQFVPQVKVLLAGHLGSGANLVYCDEVIALSKSLDLQDTIQFLGQVEEVPELLSISDLFVLPSRSEGLSNALLEAMRAELPCVATAVGGNPEVVVDGVTGFLVPSEDAASLADRILQLLREPALRRRMGMSGRKRILQQFTVEIMVSKVLLAYDRLLRAKPGRMSPARIVPHPHALVRDHRGSQS